MVLSALRYSYAGNASVQNNLFRSDVAVAHLCVNGVLSNATINNKCYNEQTNMFEYNGQAYNTVADSNTGTRFDSASNGTGLFEMNSPTTVDLFLTTTPSCSGIGDLSAGVASDYVGNLYNNPPAAGAYEVQ